jgi:hypothetical protein
VAHLEAQDVHVLAVSLLSEQPLRHSLTAQVRASVHVICAAEHTKWQWISVGLFPRVSE